MSMFTLAISCLTTSNLPWLMDLIIPVPMQCFSLQHWTLLLSPVTSTTGYCFCFGSILSFFLELFLHWSPVAYWASTDLESSSFSILSFCLFILFMGLQRVGYDWVTELNWTEWREVENLKTGNWRKTKRVNKRVQNAVLGCNLKTTEWSQFVSKANHSISH